MTAGAARRRPAAVPAVVLAAGASTRLGRPKQLLPLAGRPVLQHVVDAAVAAGVPEVVVVLGHAAADVRSALRADPRVRTVLNPAYASGLASSLRAGLRALGEDVEAAVILLGDQPDVPAEAIRRVLSAYEESGAAIVEAWYRGTRGHPILFDRCLWPRLEALHGDEGARSLLAERVDRIAMAEIDADPPLDLDTRADYERRRRLGPVAD